MKVKRLLLFVSSYLVACFFAGSTLSAAEIPAFGGIGDLPGGVVESNALDVSGQGPVVVGTSRNASGLEAVRWTVAGGLTGLGDLPGGGFYSVANGVSDDGSVVTGYSDMGSGNEAFIWKLATGMMVGLGEFHGGSVGSIGRDVSDDGLVIVGYSWSASGREAFRWTQTDGMIGLGDLQGGTFESSAHAASEDGAVIVGDSRSASGLEAFRWSAAGGMVGLGDLAGGSFSSSAKDVADDGRVIVGSGTSASGTEAFIWTQAGGMVGLGDFPGGLFLSEAWAVSSDGSVVVGRGNAEVTENTAFIWNAAEGMMSVQGILEDVYGLDLTGWALRQANGVSDDGRTIVGYGHHDGHDEGWSATLATPAGTGHFVAGSTLPRLARLDASPNPFSTETTLSFRIQAEGPIVVGIYSSDGRLVRILLRRPNASVGNYTLPWDGEDNQGRGNAAGVYFCRIESDGEQLAQRLVLLP